MFYKSYIIPTYICKWYKQENNMHLKTHNEKENIKHGLQ